MANKKEVTAPVVSDSADTEQPPNVNNNSISNNPPKNNSKMLETVSMAELYDTVYPSKPPLIDGLLYTGIYLFAGAPKLGKSFLMAQIAYHISRGIPLWDYPARKAAVLYLALEDDYRRLQERLYRMFGTDGADNLFFSVSPACSVGSQHECRWHSLTPSESAKPACRLHFCWHSRQKCFCVTFGKVTKPISRKERM